MVRWILKKKTKREWMEEGVSWAEGWLREHGQPPDREGWKRAEGDLRRWRREETRSERDARMKEMREEVRQKREKREEAEEWKGQQDRMREEEVKRDEAERLRLERKRNTEARLSREWRDYFVSVYNYVVIVQHVNVCCVLYFRV